MDGYDVFAMIRDIANTDDVTLLEKFSTCELDEILNRFDLDTLYEIWVDISPDNDNDSVELNNKNAVLIGLERMKQYDGHGNSVQYVHDNVEYTVNQMIEEINKGSIVGKEFVTNVYEMTLTYMGKFTQNAE